MLNSYFTLLLNTGIQKKFTVMSLIPQIFEIASMGIPDFFWLYHFFPIKQEC